jgi:hypothetical protein
MLYIVHFKGQLGRRDTDYGFEVKYAHHIEDHDEVVAKVTAEKVTKLTERVSL